ncbi:hypothetical protein GCM10010174_70330 [Kutzneria viridogrisea]|uniref:DUF6879 domain-containing protein n=1 Tax=Kutzneria viridogrisea TaxID=47990 RepID=A0ABR6BAU4_9PSEU|nr:hypothetical protein [Kutzneria viridogrisea]
MGQLVTREEHRELVRSVTKSAWRLEIQGTYNEPSEREPVRRYLAGEPDDLVWFQGWLTRIRELEAIGVRFERVRVLTDPLTDYLRYQLARITSPAVTAGEDIRILPATVARRLDLGTVDFWVLDDERVLVPHFVDHAVTGGELVTDPVEVARFREVQTRAWDHAVPFREYTN